MFRSLILPVAALGLFLQSYAQGTFCSPQGNVVLFSNYDGGPLTINVDQNIPDLFIGVVSYEFTKITITGPFAGNVTQVVYAGYNGNNDHCNLGTAATTSVTGAPNASVSILFAPSATFSNSNGYGSVICGYSCDVTSSQGGCNTADQIAHYFLFTYGGILRSHLIQYGCWQGVQNLSAGGNCCEDPLSTGITAPQARTTRELRVERSGDVLSVHTTDALDLVDAAGKVIATYEAATAGIQRCDLGSLMTGTYVLRERALGRWARVAVVH